MRDKDKTGISLRARRLSDKVYNFCCLEDYVYFCSIINSLIV